jgi:hypothetical protein
MSIYMQNKFRTEPEISGSKIDPSAAKKATSNFSKVFTLKVRTGELAGNKVLLVVVFS